MPLSVLTAFSFSFLFFIISAVIFLTGKYKSIHCTSETSAVIENIINRSGVTTYVFKYGVDGVEYVREHKTGSSNNPYKSGDVLTVRYNPKKPTSIIPDGKNSIYTYAFAFMILGIICLIAGGCFYLPAVGKAD